MNRSASNRVGLVLAAIQLLFATTWTVYVLFLPALAARVGITPGQVPYLLLLDQAVFVCTDLAMGIAADRVARIVGRLGWVVLVVTLVSCAAFLLLPFVAEPGGSAAPFLVLAIFWSASSSALRAPPLVLIGKHAARPAQPFLAAFYGVGLGVAGALAPLLTVALRDWDPRIPFALASVSLEVATVAILWVERRLAAEPAPAPTPPPPPEAAAPVPVAEAPRRHRGTILFFAAAALLGLGFQVHFAFNSAPLYLRFAKPPDLPYLMPAFWIGFCLFMPVAGWVSRRLGGLVVMGAGAILGAAAARLTVAADGLALEVGAQVLTGGAWGLVLMSATVAALALGRTGREGRMTGALFAGLALAALARIAVAAAQLQKDPQLAPFLDLAPTVVWGIVGLTLLILAATSRRGPEPS